jgi:hypothetical protein
VFITEGTTKVKAIPAPNEIPRRVKIRRAFDFSGPYSLNMISNYEAPNIALERLARYLTKPAHGESAPGAGYAERFNKELNEAPVHDFFKAYL